MPEDCIHPFERVVQLLPQALGRTVEPLPKRSREAIEELRLRMGQPLMVVERGKEYPLTPNQTVSSADLRGVLEIATQASAHTVLGQVQQGFVTLQGGHRIGLCGTAVMGEAGVQTLRHISSLSIRIAHQVPTVGEDILPQLLEDGQWSNTLLLSPPGCGKTTLLRDLVRRLSDGIGVKPLRVGLVDERGEVASLYQGRPQLEVGSRTDVIEGCPKGTALTMLVRGMNPQVLAVDEITAQADVEGLLSAVGCGVGLLCTAHGGSLADLERRPLYRPLVELGLFQRVVCIQQMEGRRQYSVHRPSWGGRPC